MLFTAVFLTNMTKTLCLTSITLLIHTHNYCATSNFLEQNTEFIKWTQTETSYQN